MANKTFFLLAACLCCLFVTVFGVTWKDCGSEVGKPTNVIVQGCEGAGTCVLHKGVNITFGIDFTSNEDATGLKMLVYGHILGHDVPFPIDNPDACKDSGITCPVKNGQNYSYRNYIYVKTEYPSLTLVVKLELKDQSGKNLACVVMPVKLESSKKYKSMNYKSNNILRFMARH